MSSRIAARAALLVFAIVSVAAVHLLFVQARQYTTLDPPEDIYFAWVEGRRIINGENPYARILDGDMFHNDKYATYLPGFYLLSGAAQLMGLHEYDSWLAAWRWVLEFFYIGIGLMLGWRLWRCSGALMSAFGMALWLFGRWSLTVIPIAHLDPMAAFFMIAGWIVYTRHRITGLLLFGCSLAIKQIAVFLIPVFMLRDWLGELQHGWRWAARRTAIGLAAMLAIPLAVSLPFMAWNFEGFVSSILFSAMRKGDSHFTANSIDVLAGMRGLAARLPMLAMMAMVYLGFLRGKIGAPLAALLTMTVFLQFNSVLFVQYMMWAVPFLILMICDKKDEEPTAQGNV